MARFPLAYGVSARQIPHIIIVGRGVVIMATVGETNPGSRAFTIVASVLMVVLIAYGALALMGVVR
jgi:hypothetical protein